jgi:hypothetical protein
MKSAVCSAVQAPAGQKGCQKGDGEIFVAAQNLVSPVTYDSGSAPCLRHSLAKNELVKHP